MTNYIRFFHIESHGPSFVAIEAIVTAVTFAAFAFVPARFLAAIPWRRFRTFARKRLRACLIVFLLSCCGRVALLPIEPFPPPRIQDEFSYLLASETFAHGRLTNPTPPQWHHFEAFHVLMQPTYMSKYGPAAPLFLAFGERFLGTPRAGVVLGMALAAASLCWMLQAYLPAEWALLAALIAVVRISWFSYFGNCYWGGSVALLGGCLLVGSAARLAKKPRVHLGLLFALGLLLLANTRPWEGAMISLPVCVWLLWTLSKRRRPWAPLLPGATLFAAGAAATAYYCHHVTGQFTFPWVAYWQRWGMCPPFLFGKPNYSVHYQFPEQLIYNRDGDMLPYNHLHTRLDYFAETITKLIYQWLFFIFPALSIALIGLIPTLRSPRLRVPVYCFGFACIGFLLQTWLQPHYFAVAGCILYLILVSGLRWMRALARSSIVWNRAFHATLAAVLIMVPVRLIVVPTEGFATWATWMNLTGSTPAWEDIHDILEVKSGKQLVIVRYRPDHFWVNDWIYNGYNIPEQHVVWARDSEPGESNMPLLCAYPGRTVWLLVPPESGYVRPPDRTAPWNAAAAATFLQPYPEQPLCPGQAAAGAHDLAKSN